ncbi:MAG: hypothetical protein ACJ8F7_12845 [Gemmataceae bacterium]
MRRLRQFVRLRCVVVLLAVAGQLAGAVGLPVRLPASPPPTEEPVAVVTTPFKKCCCNPDSNEPCRCRCCAGGEAAAPAESEPTSKWTLTLAAGNCQGHGPLLAGALPPALPCVPPRSQRFAPEPAGWLADDSLSVVRVILPFPTPPPRPV